MAVVFLGTSTLQTAATTRCDEFAGCLKGQEGCGGPIQHCLGRENLPVDICILLCGALCRERSHICSEAAHMFPPLPSMVDSEPVPSEHPETSQTNSSFAQKYYSCEDLGHKLSAWGRPEKMLGRLSTP